MTEYKIPKSLATPDNCALLVIDVQEKLIEHVLGPDKVITNIDALIKTAYIYKMPVLLAEQEKLGKTIEPLKQLLERYGGYNPIRKFCFSCYENEDFREGLERTNRKMALVTGLETHVCVSQTGLYLLANGYQVQIVRDATSSYSEEDRDTAIDRLKIEGATPTTTEALIFELMRSAGKPEFKKILDIVKDRRAKLKKIKQ